MNTLESKFSMMNRQSVQTNIKIVILVDCDNGNVVFYNTGVFMIRDVFVKLCKIPQENIKVFAPDSFINIFRKAFDDHVIFQIGECRYMTQVAGKTEEFTNIDSGRLKEKLSTFITKDDNAFIFYLNNESFQSIGSDKLNKHSTYDLSILKELEYKSLTLISDLNFRDQLSNFVEYGQVQEILDMYGITDNEFANSYQSILVSLYIGFNKDNFNLLVDVFKNIDFDRRDDCKDSSFVNWVQTFNDFRDFCTAMSDYEYNPDIILEKFKFQKDASIEANCEMMETENNHEKEMIAESLFSSKIMRSPMPKLSRMLKLYCWVNACSLKKAKKFARLMYFLLRALEIEEIYQALTNEEGILVANKLEKVADHKLHILLREFGSFGKNLKISPAFILGRSLVACLTADKPGKILYKKEKVGDTLVEFGSLGIDAIFTECFLNPGGTQKIEEACEKIADFKVPVKWYDNINKNRSMIGITYRSNDYSDPPMKEILTQELERGGFDNWEEAMLSMGWTKVEGTFERFVNLSEKKKERQLIEVDLCYGDEPDFCWIMNEFNRLLEPYDLYFDPYSYEPGDYSTYPNQNGYQLKREMYKEADKYFHVSTVSDFFDFGELIIPDFLQRYEDDDRRITKAFVEATKRYVPIYIKRMQKLFENEN